jgi:hypothetical protein
VRVRAFFIARPAPRVAAARAVAFGATGLARARSAAGVTWTCRSAGAPWAARLGHTSVVDAVGAIYVIGGGDRSTTYEDVWASTDGGARAGLGRGGGPGGTLGGYSSGVRRGTAKGYCGGSDVVPAGVPWVLDAVLGDRLELIWGVL